MLEVDSRRGWLGTFGNPPGLPRYPRYVPELPHFRTLDPGLVRVPLIPYAGRGEGRLERMAVEFRRLVMDDQPPLHQGLQAEHENLVAAGLNPIHAIATLKRKHQRGRRPMTVSQTIRTDATLERTWQAWVYPAELTRWFAPGAAVERRVGGAYELFFDPAHPEQNSTKGCRLLTYEEPTELVFTWKGPDEFAQVMNQDDSRLTQVRVRLRQAGEGTEVQVEHTGWGEGPDWEQARQWHVGAWDMVLKQLQEHLAGGGAAPCCQ